MICYGTSAMAEVRAPAQPRVAGELSIETTEVSPRLSLPRPPTKFRGGGVAYYLDAPAPPNNCGPHQFEVINAEAGEPRCVGLDLD
jgi:hypothetical protein